MPQVDEIDVKDGADTTRTVPTLKPLIDRVGALVAPAAGSINAQLAAVLAKLIVTPATEAKQDAAIVALGEISTKLTAISGYTDGLEALIAALNGYTDGIEAALALIAPAGGVINLTTGGDNNALTGVRAIVVGGAGTVVATVAGTDYTFTCVAGQQLNIRATAVKAASTATGMRALT